MPSQILFLSILGIGVVVAVLFILLLTVLVIVVGAFYMYRKRLLIFRKNNGGTTVTYRQGQTVSFENPMLSDPNAAAAVAAGSEGGKGGPKVAAEYNMAQLSATGSSGMVFANPVYDMETTAATMKAEEIEGPRKSSGEKLPPQPASAVIAPSSSMTVSPEAVKVTVQAQRHRSMDPSHEEHDKAQLVHESPEDVADV